MLNETYQIANVSESDEGVYYKWEHRYYYNKSEIINANDSSENSPTPPTSAQKNNDTFSTVSEIATFPNQTGSPALLSVLLTSNSLLKAKSKVISDEKKDKGVPKQQNDGASTTNYINQIQNNRIITHGELMASVTVAVQAGILGTLLIGLTFLGILCYKGVLTMGCSSSGAVHPMITHPPKVFQPHAKSSPSKSNRNTNKHASKKHKSRSKARIEEFTSKNRSTTSKKQKMQSVQNKSKLSRELTWKSRTCFTVDETCSDIKENTGMVSNQGAKNSHDLKKSQAYLQSPLSLVELNFS